MDILLLLYDVFTILLFGMPILLSGLLYTKRKNSIYLYIVALFTIYFVDVLILFLMDFVPSFSTFYESIFLTVPTLKTLVFVGAYFCYIKISELVLKQHTPIFLYAAFSVIVIFLLFVPAMTNSILKVWLYYMPATIFLVILGIYELHNYRKLSKEQRSPSQNFFRYLLYTLCIGSFFMLIENCYTFSHLASYTKLNLRIISEDIMSIFFAIFANLFLVKKISLPTETVDKPTDFHPAPFAREEQSNFLLFCKKYELTMREQDIMTLLLKNYSNEEISEELHISVGTTKSHVHNIFLKLEVNKRRQLLQKYVEYETSLHTELRE